MTPTIPRPEPSRDDADVPPDAGPTGETPLRGGRGRADRGCGGDGLRWHIRLGVRDPARSAALRHARDAAVSDDDHAAATDDDGGRDNDHAAATDDDHAPATDDDGARINDHSSRHAAADHHPSAAASEQPAADAARDCPAAD